MAAVRGGEGHDFVEWLGPDTSASIFELLNDPADLARAGAVSSSWRKFVIGNGFGKKLCVRICPEVSNIKRIDVENSSTMAYAGCSSAFGQEIMEREHRVYLHLTHCICSQNSSNAFNLHCIGASSTDNYPEESIENTLEPSDRVDLRPSYWSSGGERDQSVPECLIYRLESDLCIVDEIKLQPFKAYFQFGDPIYSAKSVRFRMGYSKLLAGETFVAEPNKGWLTSDEHYTWTYTSPVFPMSQENVLQSFKLPCPVLCIGGVVKIELLGRVQKQLLDGLYYICVCHVLMLGHVVSPELSVHISSDGVSVLKYNPGVKTGAPAGHVSRENAQEPSRWRAFAATIRHLGAARGWNQAIMNTLFGPVHFVEEDDDISDEEPQV